MGVCSNGVKRWDGSADRWVCDARCFAHDYRLMYDNRFAHYDRLTYHVRCRLDDGAAFDVTRWQGVKNVRWLIVDRCRLVIRVFIDREFSATRNG